MIEIHTPKTTSLPLSAFLTDSLLQRSPLTIPTPRDANFLEASEPWLRVIARGVNVWSARTDSRMADPVCTDIPQSPVSDKGSCCIYPARRWLRNVRTLV